MDLQGIQTGLIVAAILTLSKIYSQYDICKKIEE